MWASFNGRYCLKSGVADERMLDDHRTRNVSNLPRVRRKRPGLASNA